MIRHYINSTLRSFWKNRAFVSINVFGLGTALACCMVAFLNWNYNVKFDTIHDQGSEIYRIGYFRITNGNPIKNGNAPLPIADHIEGKIEQIDQIARVYPTGGNFKFGQELFRSSLAAVDPEFFQMFSFKALKGDLGSIQDRRTILISKEIQEKHFPDNPDPIGETLTYIDGEKKIDFKIGAVFSVPPQNSSFYGNDAYFNYDNLFEIRDWEPNDWARFNSVFLRVKDPSFVPIIEGQLQSYVEIQNKAKPDYKVHEYILDPFVDMGIRAQSETIWNHWFNASLPTPAAISPVIMALLILLIACFNFTNTSIAISNRRIKEIGVRKVHGAQKKQLVFQFLGENFVLCFVSILISLLIGAWLVPEYSSMWAFLDIRLNPFQDLELVAFLFLLLIFTTVVAGSYPAFYISSFQPSAIFRGTVKFSGTNPMTRILLTLQFTISLVSLVCGFVFLQNARYQENYDLGFEKESVIYAFVHDEAGYEAFRAILDQNPRVTEISGSRHSVSASWYTDPITVGADEYDVELMDIGHNYLSSIGAKVLLGRNFVENSISDAERSVIVNEELVSLLKWEDPIGKRLLLKDTIELFVVGVVQDMLLSGALWEPVEPMLLRYSLPKDYRFITARATLSGLSQVKNEMDDFWRSYYPDELSRVRYMKDRGVESAEVNNNIKILFLFLAVIAVILSSIGQFSLVTLNLKKRQKEIGVRKIMGASSAQITLRISREFLIILIISSVLGSSAGVFLSELLLSSIWSYHTDVGAWVILVSIGILFLIGTFTVGRKVYQASSINPAIFIQDE